MDHPIPKTQLLSPREFTSDFTSEKELSSVYGGARMKILLGEVQSPPATARKVKP